MVDRSLLEAVVDMKTELDCGTQHALKIVRLRSVYESLRLELSDFIPATTTWKEVYAAAEVITELIGFSEECKHYNASNYNEIMEQQRLDSITTKTSFSGDRSKYHTSNERRKRELKQLLVLFYQENTDEEGMKKVFDGLNLNYWNEDGNKMLEDAWASCDQSNALLREIHYPEEITGYSLVSERYVRAVLEKTTLHQEVERKIALDYVRLAKDDSPNPEYIIDSSLDFAKMTLGSIAIASSDISGRDSEVREVPSLEGSIGKNSPSTDTLIYKLSRNKIEDTEMKTLNQRFTEYVIRAIVKNRKWLAKMISQ